MAPPTPSYPELSYPELPDPSHLDPGHADPSHADPSHLDPSHPEPGLSYRGGKLSRISLLREIEETTDLKNINITDIDYPQFLLQCMRNSQPFYERIFDTIADLEDKLARRNTQIDVLIAERDDYKDGFARMSLRGLDDTRGASTTPVPETKRTTKLPDPPILTDGKDPRFEDWLSRIKNKLKVNVDHYPTEAMKIAYVEGRTGDKAARHLAPRMKEGSVGEYRNVDEVFKHLETVFNDPNKTVNARRKFRAMQMKPSDPYHEFLTEFLHLADEACIPPDQLKEELYEKLTYRLKEAMMFHRGSSGTFEEFSTYCSHAANTIQSIAEARAQTTTKTSTIGGRKEIPRRQTSGSETKSVAPLGKEKQEMMKRGLCFNCGEHGHLNRDCPRRKKAAELKAMESSVQEREMGQISELSKKEEL
jgi:Zinc knuckle